MRDILSILFFLGFSATASAQSGEEAPSSHGNDDVILDSDFVRAAVSRGEILPLSTLLPRLAAEFPGEVLDIELELDDEGRFDEYEFEILTIDGRLIEVDMNAATGEITEVGPETDDDD